MTRILHVIVGVGGLILVVTGNLAAGAVLLVGAAILDEVWLIRRATENRQGRATKPSQKDRDASN